MNNKNWFEDFVYSKYGTGFFSVFLPYCIYDIISTGNTFSLAGTGGLGVKITAEGSPISFWLEVAVIGITWLVCVAKFLKHMKKKEHK